MAAAPSVEHELRAAVVAQILRVALTLDGQASSRLHRGYIESWPLCELPLTN